MMSEHEKIRYSRQMVLPEMGEAGQKKLKNARILCIGAGGLGAPALFYLAAAGVGTIGIMDDEVVELSNLQRQILYSTDEIGQKKGVVAGKRLLALNPHININVYDEKLTIENAAARIYNYDMVLDCSDNFATRYLLNDVAYHLKKPLISASISQFKGQCSFFIAEEGPCYRCLYPSPPPKELIPDCFAGGVFGVMAGLLGTLQAMESIKYILNVGQSLVGRLLTIDALDLQFREYQLTRNPDCELCHHQTSFQTLSHFKENFCMQVEEITVEEVKSLQKQGEKFLILDVREPAEYDQANMGGKLIPIGQLPDRLDELDKDQLIVVHCKSGGRSRRAVELMMGAGFKNVKNLKGGITAWLEEK